MYRLGYNTNGLAHHRLDDALALLADTGYEGVALTLDVQHLDPFTATPKEVEEVRRRTEELGLSVAIETGARYVLDRNVKHAPNLLDEETAGRDRRVDFYARAAKIATGLGAEVVSIWAGSPSDGVNADSDDSERKDALWERLVEGTRKTLAACAESGVTLCFEPEPGMFIERPAGFVELKERLGSDGEELGMTLDVGHLLCTNDLPVGDVIRAHAAHIRHVHLDDIAGGVHEHRMFGEGDLDLPETLRALSEIGFEGMAAVELSRDSHRGAAAAEEAMQHLRSAIS
jgi:sugar phosphate isomerase/epimerase